MRTLIVEDNQVDQKIVLAAALQLGLRAEMVDNGADAIQQLHRADTADHFDLVLIDFKLPHMDGLTSSRYIRTELKLKHKPKIVLLSAYDRDDVFRVREDQRYVDDFLTKPLLPAHLSAALLALLDAPRGDNRCCDDDWLLAQARILLAEDNTINQRVAREMLERRGVKVTVAQNGQEAVNHVLNSPPGTFDIVLMDVNMPVLDGYDATRAIKRQGEYAHLPVIALTAHNSPKDRHLCLAAGMSEYLTKPVKPPLLYKALLQFLRWQHPH